MTTTITTPYNLSIIPLTQAHCESLYDLIDATRPELTNLLWAKDATLLSTQRFIDHKNSSADKIYGVFDQSGNEGENPFLVAVLELRQKNECLELGYWVGSPYRGQGYMKKAVCQLLDTMPHATVIAHVREKNVASRKILEHSGLCYSHTEIWQGEPWVHLKKLGVQPLNKIKIK